MKNNKKEKYFYSEIEDKAIVNSILDDFKKRQEDRKIYEKTWELNMNFYLGNQFAFIDNYGNISEIEKKFNWENREVFNHIAPVIETRLAKLEKIKPTLDVIPQSNSDDDLYSARLGKAIIQTTTNNNSFNSLISTATAWSEITGTAFYKVTWDNSLGSVAGMIDGKTIKNGEAVISVCSPFEIYPDSNGALEIDDCLSIIEARPYPAKTINSLWNTNLDGEDIDIFELNNSSFLSGMSGRSNITKVSHSKKHDHVLLIEKYEKPTSQNPCGRLTIICKDKLLYDGNLPYANGKFSTYSYPFVKQVSTKHISSFWGTSVIERCIPLQRAYNAIKNKKHEFIERLASGVLSVEDGSVDVDNLEYEGLAPGKILIYRNGSTPPKFLDSGSVPEELEKEEDKLLSEINKLCCVSDVTTNSSIPSGVNSGTALNMLIKQDESRLSLTAKNICNAIKEVGELIIRLYKQFSTNPRLDKFIGKNGDLEMFYWNSNNLNSDNIILDSKNELESDESEKRELILTLLDKGLLYDEDGQMSSNNKLKLLNLLGFENWEIGETIDDAHKKRAQSENLKIIELDDPLEIDNHQIHINEHIKFIISNQKDTDKIFINNLLNHIKKHKEQNKENKYGR